MEEDCAVRDTASLQPSNLTFGWPCRAVSVIHATCVVGKACGVLHEEPHPRRWKLEEDGIIQGLRYGRRDLRQRGPSR